MRKFLLGSSKQASLVCLMFYTQSVRELTDFEDLWKNVPYD